MEVAKWAHCILSVKVSPVQNCFPFRQCRSPYEPGLCPLAMFNTIVTTRERSECMEKREERNECALTCDKLRVARAQSGWPQNLTFASIPRRDVSLGLNFIERNDQPVCVTEHPLALKRQINFSNDFFQFEPLVGPRQLGCHSFSRILLNKNKNR